MKNDGYEICRGDAEEGYRFLWHMIRHIGDPEAARIVPVSPAFFLTSQAERCSEAVLARTAEMVVGVATLFFEGLCRDERPQIGTLYVLPAHRRRGLAFRLLKEAVRRIHEETRQKVFIDCVTSPMHDAINKLRRREPALGALVVEQATYRSGEEGLSWEADLRLDDSLGPRAGE